MYQELILGIVGFVMLLFAVWAFHKSWVSLAIWLRATLAILAFVPLLLFLTTYWPFAAGWTLGGVFLFVNSENVEYERKQKESITAK